MTSFSNTFPRPFISNKCGFYLITLLIGLLLIVHESSAQNKKQPVFKPDHLRVDLLRHPEAVYKNGLICSRSLAEATRLAAGPLRYVTVNSRYPGFSWTLSEAISCQNAYQIQVASTGKNLEKGKADIWSSGKVLSSQSVNVLYKGPALQPDKTYYWRVKLWSNNKESPYSVIQAFRTGDKLSDYALPGFVLTKTPGQPTSQKAFNPKNIIYDFGKDAFSQPLVSVNAAKDDTLTIRLGEKLSPNGHIDTAPPGTVRYRQVKVPVRKGRHVYPIAIASDKRNTGNNAIKMPAYIGEVLPLRFLEVKGNLKNVKIKEVSRRVIHIPFDEHSTEFKSADPTLNHVWELCKHTIKATTFAGYYVDGDRERIPYEADALINQMSHYSTDASFNMAKRTLAYLIYHPTWPTEWSLQNPLIAYNDYMYSGDARNLNIIYRDLKSKVLTALEDQNGLISTRKGKQVPAFLKSIHYNVFNGNEGLRDIVDWPHTEKETDGFVFTDYNAVVNAFYYAALNSMESIARELGLRGDEAFYKNKATAVRQAFERSFIDKKTGLIVDGIGTDHSSLHANMFAMAFGLVPPTHSDKVLAFIKSRGLGCSVYGAQFLLEALGEQDTSNYALQLLTSTGKRSWANMLQEGATMTMEAWGQQFKPNQDWNHAWGTAPANYIVQYLMGIRPLKPAFRQVEIKPHPGDLSHASIKYATIRGDIQVHFNRQPDAFQLQVTIPGNTSSKVYLPFSDKGNLVIKMDGKQLKVPYDKGYWIVDSVPSGKHEFEVQRG